MNACRPSVYSTETSAEPSLQAKQLQLKRARLADDLNDKISHRPGPIELVHKNILSVSLSLQHSLLGNYTHDSTFSQSHMSLYADRLAHNLQTAHGLDIPHFCNHLHTLLAQTDDHTCNFTNTREQSKSSTSNAQAKAKLLSDMQ